MRFDTKQPQFSCGIDVHARTLDRCGLQQDGAMRGHRDLPAGPEPLRTAVAPSRTALVVCVAWLVPWSGRAALWARAGMPFVLGHARALPALHGGQATHAKIAARTMAGGLRGERLPHASGSPAAMRATPARLRRRRPLRRTRAALLAPLQPPTSPSPRPAMGTKRADTAPRDGAAVRCPEPAVQQRRAVARALMGHADPRRRARALGVLPPATPPAAPTRALRRTVPGRRAPAPGAALGTPGHPARAPRARWRVLLSRGHVGHGSGGAARGPRGHHAGACRSPLGRRGGRRALGAGPSGGPKGSPPLGAKAAPRQGGDRPGPSRSPGRVGHVPTPTRVCSPPRLPWGRESSGRAGRRTGPQWEQPAPRALAGARPCVGERPGAQRRCSPRPALGLDAHGCSGPYGAGHTTVAGCGPSSAPRTHGRTAAVQPPLCIGRHEGTDMLRGRRGSRPTVPLPSSPRRRLRIQTCVVQPPAPCPGRGKGRQDTTRGADCARPRKADKRKQSRF